MATQQKAQSFRRCGICVDSAVYETVELGRLRVAQYGHTRIERLIQKFSQKYKGQSKSS